MKQASDVFHNNLQKSTDFLIGKIMDSNPDTTHYKITKGSYVYNGNDLDISGVTIKKGDKVKAYLLTKDNNGNTTLWFHPSKAGNDAKDLLKFNASITNFTPVSSDKKSNATGVSSPVDLSGVWDWIFPPPSSQDQGSSQDAGSGGGGGGDASGGGASAPTPLSPSLATTPLPIIIQPTQTPPASATVAPVSKGGSTMGGSTLVGTLSNTSQTVTGGQTVNKTGGTTGGGTVTTAGTQNVTTGATSGTSSKTVTGGQTVNTSTSTVGKTTTGGSTVKGTSTGTTKTSGGMTSGGTKTKGMKFGFDGNVSYATGDNTDNNAAADAAAAQQVLDNFNLGSGDQGTGDNTSGGNYIPPDTSSSTPSFWSTLGQDISNNAPNILNAALGAINPSKPSTGTKPTTTTSKSSVGIVLIVVLIVGAISFGIYEVVKK